MYAGFFYVVMLGLARVRHFVQLDPADYPSTMDLQLAAAVQLENSRTAGK